MLIRDFLTLREFQPREPTYMPVDPLVQFAHVLGTDGSPQRVRSMSRTLVPVGHINPDYENDLIARMMVQVAKGKLYRAQGYDSLTPAFWAKLTHFLDALVLHPSHKGKFTVPRQSKVFFSDTVPLDMVICLGSKDRVGTYLLKEDLRGVFLPHSSGIVGVKLYLPQ